MKRTVGIVVGVLLVIGVFAVSMMRDVDAIDAPEAAQKGPVAIVKEISQGNTDARVNPPSSPSGTDTPRAIPVPSAETSTSTANAAGGPEHSDESRSHALLLADEAKRKEANLGTLDKDEIQAAVRAVKPQIAECYEKALKHDPDLSGSLVVEFTIEGVDGGGSVTAGEINTSDMQAPFFEACVLKEVAHVPFPLPRGGGVVKVTYPFHFDQGEGHAH